VSGQPSHRSPVALTLHSFRLTNDVLLQAVAGEAVLLNLKDGVYFTLDEVGTRMIRLLGEHGDLDSAVAALEAEYEATREQIRADMERLLEEMLSHGLVERVEAQG
jgi:hypothetical protein